MASINGKPTTSVETSKRPREAEKSGEQRGVEVRTEGVAINAFKKANCSSYYTPEEAAKLLENWEWSREDAN